MRLLRVSFLILCGLLIFNGSALATPFQFTINSGAIDVGYVDTLIDYTNISPSEASEKAWLLGLGDSGVNLYKINSTASLWTQTDQDPNVYALPIDPGTDYFGLKLGTGGSNILYDHWAYLNIANLAYAVVDIRDWGTSGVNIGKVSQISTVTEPATMLLLGFGLVGLAVFGRKRFLKGA